MQTLDPSLIESWHAHVYFDAASRDALATDQGPTTSNSSAGLAKRPRTAGLPMFE